MNLTMDAADVVAATLTASLLAGRGLRASRDAVELFREVRAALGPVGGTDGQGGGSAQQTANAAAE